MPKVLNSTSPNLETETGKGLSAARRPLVGPLAPRGEGAAPSAPGGRGGACWRSPVQASPAGGAELCPWPGGRLLSLDPSGTGSAFRHPDPAQRVLGAPAPLLPHSGPLPFSGHRCPFPAVGRVSGRPGHRPGRPARILEADTSCSGDTHGLCCRCLGPGAARSVETGGPCGPLHPGGCCPGSQAW